MDFRDFAIHHHADQLYGDKPYAYHLDDVHGILLSYKSSCDPSLLILLEYFSYGHDLIEDTKATKEIITEKTNDLIAYSIDLISDPIAPVRSERKKLAYANFSDCKDDDVKTIAATGKIADRTANTLQSITDYKNAICKQDRKRASSSMRMYCSEYQGFINTYSGHCAIPALLTKLNLLNDEALSIISGNYNL